jgi:hypothetical protein
MEGVTVEIGHVEGEDEVGDGRGKEGKREIGWDDLLVFLLLLEYRLDDREWFEGFDELER